MVHLETKGYVHRDIAARYVGDSPSLWDYVMLLIKVGVVNDVIVVGVVYRNVLVTTPEVVKLADFGLSRGLQDGNYYVG